MVSSSGSSSGTKLQNTQIYGNIFEKSAKSSNTMSCWFKILLNKSVGMTLQKINQVKNHF